MEKNLVRIQAPPVATVFPPFPLFASRLGLKITLPYLLLVMFLGVVVAYVVGRLVAGSLEERFYNQLLDTGRRFSDSMVTIEQEDLALLRLVSHTEGVIAAVAQQDQAALRRLVVPLVANANIPLLILVDRDGHPVFGVYRSPGNSRQSDYETVVGGEEMGEIGFVRRVLNGETDEQGDKFAGIAPSPSGLAFYVAGPLLAGDQRVGAILVGNYLDEIVTRLDQLTLARVTLYDADGAALASTLASQGRERLQLPAGLYDYINTNLGQRVVPREVILNGREYVELFGSFQTRRTEQIGIFSVALPRDLLIQAGDLTRGQILSLFVLAIVAIVITGLLISSQIVRPVRLLVAASQRVAEGDLNQQVPISSSDEIGFLATTFNRMVAGLREREFIREAFGRFITPEVRDLILRRQAGFSGEKRVVTILFSDIRGFTALSEQYPPETVVRFLNEYFGVIVSVVSNYGGIVNKFGGDSTLVIFGAPVAYADHARRAIDAALDICSRLADLNRQRRARGEPTLRTGIGVNTGEVVAGTVGALDRVEYTVIGDTVNVSARLQGLTKDLPDYDVLVAASTYNALSPTERDRFPLKALGDFPLRGKANSVKVYGLAGIQEGADAA